MLELADSSELTFYDQRGGGRSRTDVRSDVTWRTHVEDLDRVVTEFGPFDANDSVLLPTDDQTW